MYIHMSVYGHYVPHVNGLINYYSQLFIVKKDVILNFSQENEKWDKKNSALKCTHSIPITAVLLDNAKLPEVGDECQHYV